MSKTTQAYVPGHGRATTPFGPCLLGWDKQGIFFLHFYDGNLRETQTLLDMASEHDPDCRRRSDQQAQNFADRIFDPHPCEALPKPTLRGTPFQLKVWNALLKIPRGKVVSYGDLAEKLGQPGAARAVGSAIAANHVGFLVPCHRVVRASGDTGQYRWGATRKIEMIQWESDALAK